MPKIKLFTSKLVVVGVVFLLLGCSQDIKVSELKLKQIKVGDSKETVQQQLGKPIDIKKYEFQGKLEESWTYSQVSAASTNQQVIFDEVGKVVKVIPLE